MFLKIKKNIKTTFRTKCFIGGLFQTLEVKKKTSNVKKKNLQC